MVRASNIPAYRKEKVALPDQDIRAYIIIWLASGNFSFSFQNWEEFTNYLAGEACSLERPTSAMKKLAAETDTLVLKPKPGHVPTPAMPAVTPAPEIEPPEEVGSAPEI